MEASENNSIHKSQKESKTITRAAVRLSVIWGVWKKLLCIYAASTSPDQINPNISAVWSDPLLTGCQGCHPIRQVFSWSSSNYCKQYILENYPDHLIDTQLRKFNLDQKCPIIKFLMVIPWM